MNLCLSVGNIFERVFSDPLNYLKIPIVIEEVCPFHVEISLFLVGQDEPHRRRISQEMLQSVVR